MKRNRHGHWTNLLRDNRKEETVIIPIISGIKIV